MLGLRVHMQEEPVNATTLTHRLYNSPQNYVGTLKKFSIHSFEIHIEKFSIVFSFHILSAKWCSFNPNMQCGCTYTDIELFIQTNFFLHRLLQLIFCDVLVPQTQNQWSQCEKSTDIHKLFA